MEEEITVTEDVTIDENNPLPIVEKQEYNPKEGDA